MKKRNLFKIICLVLSVAMMFSTSVFAASSRFDEIALEAEAVAESVSSNGGLYTEEDMLEIEKILKSLTPSDEKYSEEDMLEASDILTTLSSSSKNYKELVEVKANRMAAAGCGNPIVFVGTQNTGDVCGQYGSYGSCAGSVYRELYNCSPSCGSGYTGYRLKCAYGHDLGVFGQVGGRH